MSIAVAAVLVATLAFFAVRDGDGSAKGMNRSGQPAHLADLAELRALVASVGHPIYWAGPLADEKLELTSGPEGDVYVRYLPDGVEAGDPDPSFLTVGTYPVAEAAAALSAAAESPGSTLHHLPDGGIAVVDGRDPDSAYLAYPGSELEVEIYDPAPGAALGLIESGKVRPAG